MHKDITAYNQGQSDPYDKLCVLLADQITKSLPDADSKVWHGSPVWFLDGNPVVGYAVLKNDLQLLFWSGQSFEEPELEVEGSFKAAQKRYTDVTQINQDDLRRWLQKARDIQWDYKNIVKRRGKLVRLK